MSARVAHASDLEAQLGALGAEIAGIMVRSWRRCWRSGSG